MPTLDEQWIASAVVDAMAEAGRRVWLTWRPGRALMPRLAYLHAHVLVDEWEAFVAHHAAGCRL